MMLTAFAVLASATTFASAKMLDPHGIFCGQTLCYDVLEVEKGANDSVIKKNYRRLARNWHPDKNPDPDAKKKFNAVSKAYQVLSNEEERAKYDQYLEDPTEYIKKYGHHFFESSAPASDVTIVLIMILAIFSGIHYLVMQNDKKRYFKILVKAVVEDVPKLEGGSEVTQALHKEAKEKYFEAKSADAKAKKPPKKGGGAYKKDDAFKAAVEEVCSKLTGKDDPGLAEVTVWDTFTIRYTKMAYEEVMLQLGGAKTEEQKEKVICRGLGEDVFYGLTESELAELMERECWKKDKLAVWQQENGLSADGGDKKER